MHLPQRRRSSLLDNREQIITITGKRPRMVSWSLFSNYCYYSALDNRAEYCNVFMSAIISSELHVRSSTIFWACYLWPWLLWRSSDTLRISGFVNDIIFAHKPRLLDVAAQPPEDLLRLNNWRAVGCVEPVRNLSAHVNLLLLLSGHPGAHTSDRLFHLDSQVSAVDNWPARQNNAVDGAWR